MQVFYVAAGRREPIIGVVGALQYDVIDQPPPHRIRRGGRIEPAGYTAARWVCGPGMPTPGVGGRASWPSIDRKGG